MLMIMLNEEEELEISERPGMESQQNFTSEHLENVSVKTALAHEASF